MTESHKVLKSRLYLYRHIIALIALGCTAHFTICKWFCLITLHFLSVGRIQVKKLLLLLLYHFSRWKINSTTTSAQEQNTHRTACDPAELRTNPNSSTEQLKLQDNRATYSQMGFCIMQDRDKCCPCPLIQQGTGLLILRNKDHPTQTRMSVSQQNSSCAISFLVISDYKSCTPSAVKVKGLKEKYCLENSKPAICDKRKPSLRDKNIAFWVIFIIK